MATPSSPVRNKSRENRQMYDVKSHHNANHSFSYVNNFRDEKFMMDSQMEKENLEAHYKYRSRSPIMKDYGFGQ
jgi:hypothetical protein